MSCERADAFVHNGIMYLVHVDIWCRRSTRALANCCGKIAFVHRREERGNRRDAPYGDLSGQGVRRLVDAHIMALDARTGRTVWDTVIADNTKGFANSSGPIIINGKVVQDLAAANCTRPRRRIRAASSALRRADWKAAWRFITTARRDAGGDSWGSCPTCCAPAAITWIPVLRSRSQSHLLGRGAGQALDAGQRGTPATTPRSKQPTLALRPTPASSPGTVQHVPGESLDLDEVFERVLIDVAAEAVVQHRQAGIL